MALQEVEIVSMAHGGRGVGRIDGQVCFVDGGLPGERLSVRIDRKSKGVLWASIASILEPSPHRISPTCSAFGACGGCSWLHFAYPAQEEWKRRIVSDVFARIGGLAVEPGWAEEPDLRLGYRTRAEFHGDGVNWGFYASGSHTVAPMDSCALCHPKLNAAFTRLREKKLRDAVEITVNPDGEEVMAWTRLAPRLLRGFFQQVDGPGRAPEARARFMFDGAPIVNGAFAQSSLLLNRMLVRIAHEAVGGASSVLDLYCGNGNLSLGLVEKSRVLGIDHNHAAVGAAAAVGAGEYVQGGEDMFLQALARESWDAVLLDPPRTGAKEIIEALCARHSGVIVYVSCDPATQARDARALCASGWRIDTLTAVDMFPNTPHVETVCRFVRAE